VRKQKTCEQGTKGGTKADRRDNMYIIINIISMVIYCPQERI
jgi:hypothetical protein